MCTSSASSAAAMIDEARQAAEIGDVERARMGRAVGADQAGAVHARSAPAGAGSRRRARPGRRRAAGRSNRSRRTACSLRSRARRRRSRRAARRCRRRRCASGKALPNMSRPVPDGIAAVMATILSSFWASLIRLSREHLGVGRRVRLRLGLHAGDDVELDHAVILVGGFLGRRVALALLRDDSGPGSGPAWRRARSSARAAGDRDCGRRSGRRNRSRAPRTACRR